MKKIELDDKDFNEFISRIPDSGFLPGTCAVCREVGTLPFVRDGHLICRKCSESVARRRENFEMAECSLCQTLHSPQWGEINQSEAFICRRCSLKR